METEPSLSPQQGIQTARGFTLVCLGLLLLVFVIIYIASSAGTPQAEKGLKHIATLTGKGHGITEPFTVKDHWEFRWTHNGHLKQIIWRRKDGHQGMLMEMRRKPLREHGSLNYNPGGEYRMEVIGTGDWKIDVYQF